MSDRSPDLAQHCAWKVVVAVQGDRPPAGAGAVANIPPVAAHQPRHTSPVAVSSGGQIRVQTCGMVELQQSLAPSTEPAAAHESCRTRSAGVQHMHLRRRTLYN